MALTEQQKAFFETFGFLVFRGMLTEDLPWINEGFEEIFTQVPEKHDGTRRTIAGTDTSEKLCRLLDHPKVIEAASSLMGDDFNYLGGDANYYVGDTGWHSDGWHDHGLFVKWPSTSTRSHGTPAVCVSFPAAIGSAVPGWSDCAESTIRGKTSASRAATFPRWHSNPSPVMWLFQSQSPSRSLRWQQSAADVHFESKSPCRNSGG